MNDKEVRDFQFQYRKRYEVTCDSEEVFTNGFVDDQFQYRKRYEVTCDPFWDS